VTTLIEFGTVPPAKLDTIQSRIIDVLSLNGQDAHPDLNKMTVNLRRLIVNHVIAVRPPSVTLVAFCVDDVDRRWINEYAFVGGGDQLKRDLETWIAVWLQSTHVAIRVTMNCIAGGEAIAALSKYIILAVKLIWL